MRIGIFLPNWIGDVVMATPTVRAVREHYGPEAEIVGIMRPYVADVLAGTPWLSEKWLYDRHASDRNMRRLALVRKLRRQRLDLAILLTNSLSTALIACLGGARQRVGYVRYGRGPLLTDKLSPPRDGRRLRPVPAIDYYLELARAIGSQNVSRRMELATLAGDEKAADAVWSRLGLSPDEQVVLLNSGGAYGAAKHWPAEHCGRLARRVAEQSDMAVLETCGPAERDAARKIVSLAAHPRVVSLADEPLTVGLSKACIARGRLMISTDSGPRHMAVALGVPTIALFGPTDPVWSESYFDRAVTLRREVDCGPCHRRVCPHGHHKCMQELTVDTVYASVQQQLAASSQRAA